MNNIKIQQHNDDNQQTPFDNDFKYEWVKFDNKKYSLEDCIEEQNPSICYLQETQL